MDDQISLLEETLKQGIEIEEKGINFYSASAQKIKDPNGKATLEFLANEEKKHKELFQKILGRVSEGEGTEKISSSESELLSDLKKPSIFPKAVEFDTKVDGEDRKILEEAKKFEVRSIEFYTERKSMSKSEFVKNILGAVIHEEESHKELVEFQKTYLESHGYWSGMEDHFSLE